jgi:stage V sporulation protein B
MSAQPQPTSGSHPPPGSTGGGRGALFGALFILAAKVWFILAGGAIQLGLPSLLGSAAAFGVFHLVVTTTTSALNNVVVGTTIQTVSKFTTLFAGRARAVRGVALGVQLRIGLVLTALFLLAAPLLVRLSGDTFANLGAPLTLAAPIVLFYALYSTFVGSANGQRRFDQQAALDMIFAALRASLILGAAWVGLGVLGSVGGFVVAAALILALAARWSGRTTPPDAPAVPSDAPIARAPMLRYWLSLAAYVAWLNVLMNLDVWVLKVATTRALGAGAVADRWVGYYGGAQNFARLSYQIMIALTFVLFPLVSEATFAQDREAARRYIGRTIRYALLIAVAIASVLLANPSAVLAVPYATEYRVASTALVVLGVGNVALALLTLGGTVLNAAGDTRTSLVLMGATVAMDLLLNVLVASFVPPGPQLLTGCAVATTVAMVLGLIGFGRAVTRRFGLFVELETVVRASLACAVACGLGAAIPERSRLFTLAESVLVGAAFVLTLVATGELGARELAPLGDLVARRRR